LIFLLFLFFMILCENAGAGRADQVKTLYRSAEALLSRLDFEAWRCASSFAARLGETVAAEVRSKGRYKSLRASESEH
jgi:hypothetical protein